MSDENEQPQPAQPQQPQDPQHLQDGQQPLTQPQQHAVQPTAQQQYAPAQQPHSPAADGRDWVPVPPPHPYANQLGAAQPGGKVLAIIAMALGLVALLTVLVSAFYFSPAIAYSGAAIGAIAIIVGIIALVKRSHPFGASIAGTATGTISLLVVGVLVLVGSFAQSSPLVDGSAASPDPGASGEGWTPDAEQESLVQWPANMATGGIIFMGPGDPRPVPSDPVAPGTSPATKAVDRDTANDMLIYVDYSCPHCAALEQTSGDFLTEVLTNEMATIEIVPLSFMDRASTNEYSSRAAGAVACLANSQPEAAWAGHSALLNPELQPNGGAGLTNDEIIELFDHAVGGLGSQAADCIRTEQFVVFAKALNEWVFQNPVPNAVEAGGRIEGTPSVFVNGVFYPGGADDPAALRAFFEEQTN